MRVHGFLRDQRMVAGIGRRLANEVCHRAKVSPFANTRKLGADGAGDGRRRDSLRASPRVWRTSGSRADMSSSKERPGRGARSHRRGVPGCAATPIRAVAYSGYTVNYCPTCQTDGKILADNTTSKFLK